MTKKDKALIEKAINELAPVLEKYRNEIQALRDAEFRKYQNARSERLLDEYENSYCTLEDLIAAIDDFDSALQDAKDAFLSPEVCFTPHGVNDNPWGLVHSTMGGSCA